MKIKYVMANANGCERAANISSHLLLLLQLQWKIFWSTCKVAGIEYMSVYHCSYAQCILAIWVFLNLKQTSFETRKNGFYFTSKACFVLEIFEFKNFEISNFMTSSNAWVWNKKYILCNFTTEKFLSKNYTKDEA